MYLLLIKKEDVSVLRFIKNRIPSGCLRREEVGERLQAMAFVGNLTTKSVIPVMIQPGSVEDKDQSARTIQSAALALEADFVCQTACKTFQIRGGNSVQ